VITTAVPTGAEALGALNAEQYDCMVLDLKLPDMTGFELIEKIQTELGKQDLPIIVYTGKELTEKEETQLRRVADAIIVKEASSPERLLAETALFLHRVEANLPEQKRRMLEQLHRRDPVLAHKKVLIVDDDVRNIFALTSALESHDMDVVHAENGKDALTLLTENADIDVVLMDIMMPEMDGYETTAAIRQIEGFENLPIIALTAKAMKADREKCIQAGASDYISKPLDVDQLLSLLRVWLYDKEDGRA
jgi:CheY-like chemotaxis protein